MSLIDWPAAWAALREMDGEAWDAESERLDVLWREAYLAEFVRFALTRLGWDEENATVWARELVADALIDCAAHPPEDVARTAVLECERQSDNACPRRAT